MNEAGCRLEQRLPQPMADKMDLLVAQRDEDTGPSLRFRDVEVQPAEQVEVQPRPRACLHRHGPA